MGVCAFVELRVAWRYAEGARALRGLCRPVAAEGVRGAIVGSGDEVDAARPTPSPAPYLLDVEPSALPPLVALIVAVELVL